MFRWEESTKVDRPYLTIEEAAELLRLSPHGLRNKMSRRIFKRNVHYFKREGQIGVRFKRAALVAWLEDGLEESEKKTSENVINMARGYRLGAHR